MFPLNIFRFPNLLISLQPTKILPFHQKNGIASNDTSKRDFCAKTLVGFSSSVQYIDFPFLFNIFIAYSECSVVVYSPPLHPSKVDLKIVPRQQKVGTTAGERKPSRRPVYDGLVCKTLRGHSFVFPVANLPFSFSWESGTCGQGGFFSIFH